MLSLTSLNLSNFNTNNITNMEFIFNDLNMKCEIKCNDIKLNKLIEEINKKKKVKIKIKILS